MDPQLDTLWRIIAALLAVSAVAESQPPYRQGPRRDSLIPTRFTVHKIPPRATEPPAPAPAPRRAVAVRCHPGWMEVVARADLLDTGLHVDPRYLHLGPGPSRTGECGAVRSAEEEFSLQAGLMSCGTQLSSTNEHLIYSNVLVYNPEPSPDGVLRLDAATFPVECHYEKRYFVDGSAVQPAWSPFNSKAAAEDQIDFNLQLMTDDWQFERGSGVYFLGDPIHLEASVVMGQHLPLRIFVDHCVATVTPETDTALRYDFIDRHGCLVDAYMTASRSRFLPRVQEHKLRFWLEAFRFYQESTSLIYITCQMRAVPVKLAANSHGRACSFINDRWISVDGNDQACRSCNTSQGMEPELAAPSPHAAQSPRGNAAWNRPDPDSYSYSPPGAGAHQTQHSKPSPPSSYASVMKRGAVPRAKLTKDVQSGPLIILPSVPSKETVSMKPLHHKTRTATEHRLTPKS